MTKAKGDISVTLKLRNV